jgi:serine protease AprX
METSKNDLLFLHGSFGDKDGDGGPIPLSLWRNKALPLSHILKIKQELEQITQFWEHDNVLSGALINVSYCDITPKTRRVQTLLSLPYRPANSAVVGAKYGLNLSNYPCHIITYCISKECLAESLKLLDLAAKYCSEIDGQVVTAQLMQQLNSKDETEFIEGLPKKKLCRLLQDCSNVEAFLLPTCQKTLDEESVVTIYNVGLPLSAILKKIDLPIGLNIQIIDDTTAVIGPKDFETLKAKVPYLIAMSFPNLSLLPPTKSKKGTESPRSLKSPTPLEPIIGVVDSGFDDRVYFHNWVEYHEMLPAGVVMTEKDKIHGTEVDSILVDGPYANPELDDECGNFRVRHFGLGTASKIDSAYVMSKLETIIRDNSDIHIWNLSLGSPHEIDPNFVSPAAAELDRLQSKYNVLFVVCGTNDDDCTHKKRIGSPADSVNSLVVNSVRLGDKKPASYFRRGPVLSFFRKPDISYYGGDDLKPLGCCGPDGFLNLIEGTSFSTPWIARKAAYLFEKMKLGRELTKALLIHSATDWVSKRKPEDYETVVMVLFLSKLVMLSNPPHPKFVLSLRVTP